jgi:hypothetical protein
VSLPIEVNLPQWRNYDVFPNGSQFNVVSPPAVESGDPASLRIDIVVN